MSVRASAALAAYLLGRHRVRRSGGDSCRHDRGRRRRVGKEDVVTPREAEVDDLETPAGDDRVARLEVTMDHAVFVRVRQCIGGLDAVATDVVQATL